MDKINFKNLPNKTTPINAENLNKIQENMEKAINEKSSLPVGGDEGQILAKASNQDNDVEWIDNIGQGGGDTLPIGAILPFSGDNIPNGWLLCDGSVIEQEDYPELFEVLAGKYGIISREEIRLPDLRGKVTVGKDSTDADFDTLGNTGGEKTHTLTVSELPSHSHIINSFRQYETGSSTDSSKLGRTTTGADGGSSTIATGGTGGNEAHNNLQPYIVTNYIIKAKMTIVTVGEVIQENDTATTENVYSASAINNKIKTNIVTGQEFATNEYIDNKQVFLTAFKFTSLSDSMVINSNIDYIKAIHCNIKDSSGGNWRTIPWIYNSSTYDSSFAGGIYVSSSGAIGFQAGTGLANISKGYVEVYYTKN